MERQIILPDFVELFSAESTATLDAAAAPTRAATEAANFVSPTDDVNGALEGRLSPLAFSRLTLRRLSRESLLERNVSLEADAADAAAAGMESGMETGALAAAGAATGAAAELAAAAVGEARAETSGEAGTNSGKLIGSDDCLAAASS